MSTLRALVGLSWPIVLARATQAVIGFSDAVFVAPLGEAPLAAVTTGALNSFAFIVMPMATVFIVQSFVAQLRGAGRPESASRYAWYGLAIAGLAGIFAALVIPFIPAVLATFHYAPDVHRMMSTYLGIRLWSIAAAVGAEALGNYYGGLGNTRPSMVCGVVAMTLNVLGCYALVLPRFGLPGFGVVGSAWASVAASWSGFLVIGVPFFASEWKKGSLFRLGLRREEFLRVLRFGIPHGMNWFLEFAAFALFIDVVVGHLGTTILAAFNVVMQINSMSFMPAMGLASGGAILVGESIGKKEPDAVWPVVRLTAIVASAWMMSVGVVYAVAPRLLMSLFESNGDAAALTEIGAKMLLFSAVWQLFDALSLTFGEALRAAGDTTWCMAARVVLAWIFFTPAAWAAVLVYGGEVSTVMTSLVLYLAALSTTLGLRFASGRWRQIDLVGAPAP